MTRTKIERICAEVKRLEVEAATRDVECDCDGSDPLNYHTANCAGRREMQRRTTARKACDAYLREAAPLLVEYIESLERSPNAMRALVEDMVITMRHVPKDALFDALQQWHRKASTALAQDDAKQDATTMISPPVDAEELRRWQSLTQEERSAAIAEFKKANGR